MANIKSQIKRNKQNLVRQERNKAVRSELRTRVKTAVAAGEAGAENAEAAAKLVLDLGRDADTPAATRVELATSLVVRSSTGSPPAG